MRRMNHHGVRLTLTGLHVEGYFIEVFGGLVGCFSDLASAVAV